MTVRTLDLPEVFLIEPRVFEDDRGSFFESWNSKVLETMIGTAVEFVQDNHSSSRRGVLRGLHYQVPPHAQGKLIRVVKGRAFDVAIDIRRSSPSFGKWVSTELSDRNRRQVWVPAGFAHGVLALSDTVDVLYKQTTFYEPDSARSIRWDDPDIGIDWPIERAPLLSERDRNALSLKDADVFD